MDLAGLRDGLLGPDVALSGLSAAEIGSDDGRRFVAGQAVKVSGDEVEGLARVYAEGVGFLGVGEVSPAGELAPRRVFKTSEKTP